MKGFLKTDDYRVRFPPLKRKTSVDFLVVGGGLEGIMTAYLAAEKGFRVAVAERYFIGSGRTAFLPGYLTADTKSANAYARFKKRAELISRAAKEAGGVQVSELPYYLFSEKSPTPSVGAEFFRGESISVFRQAVPDGVFFQKGALVFSPLTLCKALAEKCRLSGVQICETTRIASVFGNIATTGENTEIEFRKLINATGNGEHGKTRFLVRAEFVGENLPKTAFADEAFSPLSAFSADGKKLDATVVTRTFVGALAERRRLGESLSSLLPISSEAHRSYIGKCEDFRSVSDICERCISNLTEARHVSG